MASLMSSLELPSSRPRLTMEPASGTAPTLSTSPTAGSSMSATTPMTPMAMLPRSPTTALPPTLMSLSELVTVLSAMPSLALLLSPTLLPLLVLSPSLIVFSFSKKECEAYALQMAKLDFNTPEEKKLVDEVFSNAMMVLSEEDRSLPQVENVLPLLKRGIGIHHGGLLPILKETIEILFGEGLLKALFATETFAMGLNMPARTVLFTSTQKFDGKDFRFVTSGEYIQMSGRAGRRGLDDKGIVILMVDEKMSPSAGRDIVKGLPDAFNSAFHLTYNMVLNLLRVEEVNPEYMMERSFHQFQNYSNIPQIYQNVKELETLLGSMKIPGEEEVSSYARLRDQLSTLGQEFHTWLTKPQYIVPFLQPGRLVRVKSGDQEFGR